MNSKRHTTTYIKHAGTLDFNLLFWSAGTFYIQALGIIEMITSINIETRLWNKILSELKGDKWIETFRYDGFDAGIDSDFAILEKDGEEILFGWDNWVEGEIQCSDQQMRKIEQMLGVTLKKGEPVNLKLEVIKLYKPNKKAQ